MMLRAAILLSVVGLSYACTTSLTNGIVNNMNSKPTTAKPPPTKPPTGCKCGKAKRVAKIVNGIEAEQHEYPWQVGMAKASNYYINCGGSIISSKSILTAAHCTYGKTVSDFGIWIGQHDQHDSSHGEFVRVCAIHNHPNYNDDNYDYDIAVLTLCDEITFDETKSPVCLPSTLGMGTFYEDKTHVLSGWGDLSSGYLGNVPVLRETKVDTISNSACCNTYGYACSQITDRMICAYTAGTDSCQGDSGGPMVYDSAGTFYQTGVVSWGKGCALTNFPGVYARVTYLLDFVQSKMTGSTCSA